MLKCLDHLLPFTCYLVTYLHIVSYEISPRNENKWSHNLRVESLDVKNFRFLNFL